MKIERNDLCPCGSNKKYKKCCLPLQSKVEEECHEALAKVEAGDVEEAKIIAERLIKTHSHNALVQFLQGVCCIIEEEFDDAIDAFEKAVEIYPLFSDAHFNLGCVYVKTGLISVGVNSFDRVIDIEGMNSDLGDRVGEELDRLEEIMQKSGVSLEAYLEQEEIFSRGYYCLMTKKYREAIELFEQVISLNPQHVQSYGNMGLAYSGLGDQEKALECLDKALEIDPEYEPAQVNRIAITRLKKGEDFDTIMTEVSYYKDKMKQERVLKESEVVSV